MNNLTLAEARASGLQLPPGPTSPLDISQGKIQNLNMPLIGLFGQYGDTVCVEVNGIPMIASQDPTVIGHILLDKKQEFVHGYGDGLNTIFSGSLPVLPHAMHRALRPKLNPAFNVVSMGRIFSNMGHIIDGHIQLWSELKEFNALEVCTTMTLDIVANLIGLQPEDYKRYGELYRHLSSGLFHPLGSPKSSRAIEARELLKGILGSVIGQRRIQLKDDITSFMIQEGLTDEEIVNQDMVLGFAGHETVKAVSSAALMELSSRPELISGIRTERDSATSERGVTFRPTPGMGLTNRIILATLLTHMPVTILPRMALQDSQLPNGYIIPKGWSIQLMMEAMHDKVFKTRAFDPDRFINPSEEERRNFTPFGLGPHFCIGAGVAVQEVYMFLQRVADYSWEIEASQGTRGGDIIVRNFAKTNP